MPRILYGVSPIGLGHATRALVVAGHLVAAGAEVRLYSGRKVCDFLETNGIQAEEVVLETGPSVWDGEMKLASLWYLRSWLGLRREEGRVSRLTDEFRPDLVVCDEEFAGMVVAGRRGVKRVLISDELELGFARSKLAKVMERRVDRWYRGLQESVDRLIVPDYGDDRGNRAYVGPIVREPKRTRAALEAEYGLPAGPMVLVSLSGSGTGSYLVRMTTDAVAIAGIKGAKVVVTGNRGKSLSRPGVFDLGVVPWNHDLVAAADIVVSTAGKSTIDEAAAAGTPIIPIPIKHHAEQERNALALGFSEMGTEGLSLALGSKIGRREAPQKFRGGENASRLIFSLV